MIVIKLQGGLGNQLFQYALGVALAEKYSDKLTFELESLKDSNSRKLDLLHFNTSVPEISSKEYRGFHSLKNRFLRKLKLHSLTHYKVHYQKQFKYYPIDHNKNTNTLYVGYWQSPLNFQNVNELIREQFTLKRDTFRLEGIKAIQEEISVAIHVRRGDYLNDDNGKVHINLPMEYYLNAVEKMQQLIPGAKYFVFSDDIDWVVNNFKIPVPWQPVLNNGYTDAEVMILMSKCRHQIIANSTFSWWAAWLNPNSNKIIIRPKSWFANGIDESDLIPDNWIKA
jgi:hypothetical protein